jgi:hypothetical protein
MPNHISLSLATTASGILGGVSRAVTEQVPLSTITLTGVVDVAAYAVVSASVGYCVKVVMDMAHKRISKSKN